MIQTQYTPNHYTGNGTTANLTFSWRILAKSDLIVKVQAPVTGTVTTLTLDSDYTIDDSDVNTSNGGEIVLDDPAAWDDYEIWLLRRTSLTQLVNIEEGASFPAATVNKTFDRLTMMAQELYYATRKALKFGDTSEFIDIDVPDLEAGALFQVNSDADGLQSVLAGALEITHAIIGPQGISAAATTAVITHNLNSASASVIGFSSTWHTGFAVLSQTANTITIEFSTECPAGGGTIKTEVAI